MSTFSSSSRLTPFWHLAIWGFVGVTMAAACGGSDESEEGTSTAGTSAGGSAGSGGSTSAGGSSSGGSSTAGTSSSSGGGTSTGGATGAAGATGSAGDTGSAGAPAGADCGDTGQACCLGDVCNAGGCCIGNVCIADGDTCPGGTGSNLCSAGACEDCGGNAQQCCSTGFGGGSCQPGYVCAGGGGGGICEDCGTDGIRCCADQQCTEGVCIDGGNGPALCQAACGAPDDPCCEVQDGSGCQPGLTCNADGNCEGTVCGLPGDACCVDGDACVVGGYDCISDTCQSCGGMDQACCPNNFDFNGGCGFGLACDDASTTCVDDGCGAENEPCCNGGQNDGCDTDLVCDQDMCVAP